MDKLKCLSFFKCRRKEVGVCELRTCGGLGKGKLKERQISAFALKASKGSGKAHPQYRCQETDG